MQFHFSNRLLCILLGHKGINFKSTIFVGTSDRLTDFIRFDICKRCSSIFAFLSDFENKKKG
mgnify:CR=1 FL=1